jgi:hypothetical protein
MKEWKGRGPSRPSCRQFFAATTLGRFLPLLKAGQQTTGTAEEPSPRSSPAIPSVPSWEVQFGQIVGCEYTRDNRLLLLATDGDPKTTLSVDHVVPLVRTILEYGDFSFSLDLSRDGSARFQLKDIANIASFAKRIRERSDAVSFAVLQALASGVQRELHRWEPHRPLPSKLAKAMVGALNELQTRPDLYQPRSSAVFNSAGRQRRFCLPARWKELTP